MVDRTAIALGAVACQTFPHRQSRLALDDRFTDRLTVALADEPDRLAIRGPLFAVRLAVLPVSRLVSRAGGRLACLGRRRGAAPTGSSPAAAGDGAAVLRMRDVLAGPGGDESRWPWGSILLFKTKTVNLCDRCCPSSIGYSINRAGQVGEDGDNSFHLMPQRIDFGVVVDDQISPAALLVGTATGLAREPRTFLVTSLVVPPLAASAAHAGHRQKQSDRTGRPSRPRARSPRRAPRDVFDRPPVRVLTVDRGVKRCPHSRMNNGL